MVRKQEDNVGGLLSDVAEDVSNFDEVVKLLRSKMLSGGISQEFAVGGIESIISGALRVRSFDVWKSVTRQDLECCFTALLSPSSDLLEHLEKQYGVRFRNSTQEWWLSTLNHIFRDPESGTKEFLPEVMNFTKVTIKDFGFDASRVKRDTVWRRARELDLYQVPYECAPWLRVNYIDQPRGEWVELATRGEYLLGYHQLRRGGSIPRLGCLPGSGGMDELILDYKSYDPTGLIRQGDLLIFSLDRVAPYDWFRPATQ